MPTDTTMPTILIIDDDVMLSGMLANALKDAGYSVLEAADGQAGLQIAMNEHPSLAIIDYKLPDIDGLELIKTIRADEWGKVVPLILSTNVYEVEVMNAVMQLGVQDYILKADVDLQEIIRLVGSYVPAGPGGPAAPSVG